MAEGRGAQEHPGRRLRDKITRPLALVSRNVVWVIELVWISNIIRDRELMLAGWRALQAAILSALNLLWVDAAGTAGAIVLVAVKLGVAFAALGKLATRLRGWRLLRLPVWLFVAVLAIPLACTACPTPTTWVLLLSAAAFAFWCVDYRFMRWTVLLPIAVLLTPAYDHYEVFDPQQQHIAEHCATNDGERPHGAQPGRFIARFYGLSMWGPGELLLTGSSPRSKEDEHRKSTPGGNVASWWLRRGNDGWTVERESSLDGILWNACSANGALWLLPDHTHTLVGVVRNPETREEAIRTIALDGSMFDSGIVTCRANDPTVYVTEAVRRVAMWAVSTETGVTRRLANVAGGVAWITKARRDGLLVGSTGSDVVVYSPEREAVLQRLAGALFGFPSDIALCENSNAVAVTDWVGRVRVFEPDADGKYRFSWGISVRAPRFIAYSPDCLHLAVTSADDQHVWLIETTSRQIVKTYRVGPALGDVLFLGPREFAIADACTMSDFLF